MLTFAASQNWLLFFGVYTRLSAGTSVLINVLSVNAMLILSILIGAMLFVRVLPTLIQFLGNTARR